MISPPTRATGTAELSMEGSADSTQSETSSRSEETHNTQEGSQAPAAAATGEGSGSGSFDCNICLELAQDPVVTLCGHLFCWPCLYRWLEVHSISKECPVCKASVVEEKVIPLYGRGKIGTADPRTKPVPGVNIPHRPVGHRTDSGRSAENPFQPHGFNFMPGHAGHIGGGHFGNITFSAGFGLFPSLFGFQLNGFPDNSIFSGTAYGASSGNNVQPLRSNQQQEVLLYRLFIVLVCLMVACLLFF